MSSHRSIGRWPSPLVNAAIGIAALSFGALGFAARPALADGGSGNDCTQNVGESCSVAQPITLVNVTGINFGRIISGTAAGTITISPAGQVSTPPTASGPALYTNNTYFIDPSAATFYVTGEPSYDYAIITPATTTVSDGHGHTMTVTLGVPVAASVNGHAPSGKLNASGTLSKIAPNGFDAWAIGGTLVVGASQPSGEYHGTFNEEVQYQ